MGTIMPNQTVFKQLRLFRQELSGWHVQSKNNRPKITKQSSKSLHSGTTFALVRSI